jgi:uncharacterized protein YlaN (UPF0358 family)
MTEIAVVIIDPEKERWAQLADDQARIRELLPIFVGNLKLPEKLNYELLLSDAAKALSEKATLAAAGVVAGDELLIRPKRDSLLTKLLDKLYDEAKGYVKDKAWEMAKERMKAILRLDPQFPDPDELGKAIDGMIATGKAAVKKAASGKGAAKTGKQKARKTAAKKAAEGKAKPGCSTGCIIASVAAVGGVIVIGGIIALVTLGPSILDLLSPQGGDVVLGTGDVQVTLRWETSADLDLHVVDPWGEEIYFSHQRSQSGGELDVDANAACRTQYYTPVENIYWPTGGAPYGTYVVSVVNYRDCGATGYTSYEVIVRLDGRVYNTYRGEIYGAGEEHFITQFDW